MLGGGSMIAKKKLQVFGSSTYSDLKEERQAAVEAILSACHIPAGMELFAAGDESQMEVIRRWIDESDIFLLILGGRYGSLEPTSKKSYIELEYEYAQERGKPFFAVVIHDDYLKEKVKICGADIIETDNARELKAFRTRVLSKLVRFFSDPRDIKLAIHETLSDFGRREDLIGWIPGDQAVNSGEVAEQIARLAKENTTLRERLSKTDDVAPTFCGLPFNDICQMLGDELIDSAVVERDFGNETLGELESVLTLFKDSKPTLLHLLWLCRDVLASEYVLNQQEELFDRLRDFGLVEITRRTKAEQAGLGGNFITVAPPTVSYGLTDDGRRFLLRLRLELKRRAEAGGKVRWDDKNLLNEAKD
jgi:Domain of unknown function (DUF4062)